MSKTMAAVLAEHRMSPQDYAYCICGAELSPKEDGGWTTHEVMEAHQAAALSAAGFGLVTDAKAEAALEAAKEALAKHGNPPPTSDGTFDAGYRAGRRALRAIVEQYIAQALEGK